MDLQTITGATDAQRAQKAHKAHDAAARASFAGALAKASTKSAADTPESVLNAKKAPKGEKSAPVKGHAYADVTAGPRNGMFINTSGNARDGQAFVLVKRDGKEFHIYGSGKDRVVVCLKRKDDAPKPSGTTGAASS
jgi:uncharacterized membrane protein